MHENWELNCIKAKNKKWKVFFSSCGNFTLVAVFFCYHHPCIIVFIQVHFNLSFNDNLTHQLDIRLKYIPTSHFTEARVFDLLIGAWEGKSWMVDEKNPVIQVLSLLNSKKIFYLSPLPINLTWLCNVIW